MSIYTSAKFDENILDEECDGKKGKAKAVFISKLKSFLKQEKGPYITD